MKFLKIIIVLLVVSSPFNVHAREDKSVSDTINASKTVLPEIKQNTDSTIIEALKMEIATLKEKENILKGTNFDNDQIIKSKDAEIKRLNNHLILSDSIKESKIKRLIFADSIIARISNDCLLNKYDPIRVDEALVCFSKMYSKELQSKFSPLEKLLKQYSKYSKEIFDILAEAENDPKIKNTTTGKTNLVTGKDNAQLYIGKIKSTRYYQDVYSANWTIPYLNKGIDRVINYLKAFVPKVNEEFKLLDKMN